jgi:hypothetical protein
VSNRNKIKEILACFLTRAVDAVGKKSYHHPDDFGFVVSRQNNRICFESLTPVRDSTLETPGAQDFGSPFERACTVMRSPEILAFYRYNSFDLLDTPLIVRAEIDCVDKLGNYYELKSKNLGANATRPRA